MVEKVVDFVRKDSWIRVFIDEYFERPDVAEKAVCFEGNLGGFRSLMEIICFYLNELEDELRIVELPCNQ